MKISLLKKDTKSFFYDFQNRVGNRIEFYGIWDKLMTKN